MHIHCQGNQLDLLNSAGSGYLQLINTASGTISSAAGEAGRIRFFSAGHRHQQQRQYIVHYQSGQLRHRMRRKQW